MMITPNYYATLTELLYRNYTPKESSLITFCTPNGVYHLNQALVDTQHLNVDDIFAIQNLHCIKQSLIRYMERVNDVAELRTMAKLITKTEFALQKAWKFPQDQTFHRWFEVPKCQCPKDVNIGYVGHPHGVCSHECPIHSFSYNIAEQPYLTND